ncbi:MAG: redoxin domain-containing protein [Bacteroidales bacterium]|nr:redoxin domain-containing protein [Bacteroidales bacterium]
MKKIFTLLFAIALSFNMMAQCPLTTAVDFTATDCHGTEVHLFDILDGGQYVLMDFFFTTCGPCQQATPKVVESYYAFGCNMYDVFYIEVSVSDGDAACQNWAANYGVEYPTISTAGGGATICNSLYQIGQYPTVILIAPDRSILIQDLWPINNAQTIINALTPYGIQQHDCTAPVTDPEVTITVDQALETEITATFTPNAECAEYHYTMGTESELAQWAASAGLSLPEYVNTYGFPADIELSHTFTDLEPNTEYVICAVPADADGNIYEMAQTTATTTPGGGGEIMPDFTGTDLEGNEIHLYDILDAGQYVLINFFLAGDPYSQDIMGDMVEAYHMYGCNEHDVFFMEISPNGDDSACQNWVETYGVQYPTISRDGGGNDIAQAIPVGYYPTIMLIRPDHTFAQRDIYPPTLDMMVQYMSAESIQQYDCDDSVDEMDAGKVTLYPNPADNFLKINGENLGNVMIYNAMGQKVAEFVAGDELNLATSDFENGVYFVKVGDKTQRFVVTH